MTVLELIKTLGGMEPHAPVTVDHHTGGVGCGDVVEATAAEERPWEDRDNDCVHYGAVYIGIGT